MKNLLLFSFCALNLFFSCTETKEESKEKPLNIVFVTGDEEYRSEESMPMLAAILKRELNCNVKVCYALDSAGFIDPNRPDHISDLQALDSADLMVMFTRFRALPNEEVQYILN